MRSTLFLLLGLLVSQNLFAQNQTINLVLGDTSWTSTYSAPSGEAPEDLRVSTHLRYVIDCLKEGSTADSLMTQRQHQIQLLEEYVQRGQFPVNEDYPGQRRPCFIDASGNICVVGYLVEQTAGREEAERINKRYQYAYIRDMEDEGLLTWQKTSGLSLRELEMIQPEYWNPRDGMTTEEFQESVTQKWGVREIATGKVITRAKYDDIAMAMNYYHTGAAKKDGKWGIINEKGRLLTKTQYQNIHDYYDFLLAAVDDSTVHVYRGNGKRFVKGSFDEIAGYQEPYLIVRKDGYAAPLDKDGHTALPFEYEQVDWWMGRFRIKTPEGYGLLTEEGKVLIPAQYDELNLIKDKWIGIKDGKKYIFNLDGKQGSAQGVDEVYGYGNRFHDPELLGRSGDHYGVLSADLSWKIPPEYDTVYHYLDYHVVLKDGLIGYYNNEVSGFILPLKYTNVHAAGGNFMVKANGRWGLVSREGKVILPEEQDTIFALIPWRNTKYCYAVFTHSKGQIYSIESKLLTDTVYDEIKRLSDKTFRVCSGGTCYLGTYQADTLAIYRNEPFQHVDILYSYALANDLGVYKRNGKSGLWELRKSYRDMVLVTEPVFDTIQTTPVYNTYLVCQDGLYGLIYGNGKWKEPARYKAYEIPENVGIYPYLLLQDERGWYRINRDGSRQDYKKPLE